MEYQKNISQAFIILKHFPILFVPDLIFYLLFSFAVYLFYQYSGFAGLFGSQLISTESQLEIIQSFLTTNLAQIIISTITFCLVTFVIGVSVYAIKYSLITQILNKKYISLKREIKLSQKYIYQIILIKIFIYVVSALALFIITVLSAIFYLSLKTLIPSLANPLTGIFAGLLIIGALLIIKVGFLFRYPILFIDRGYNAFKALKKTFKLFMKHPGKFFLIWLIIIIVTFIFSLFHGILDYIIYSIDTLNFTIQTILAYIIVILGISIKLIQLLWSDVYTFLSYNSYRKR